MKNFAALCNARNGAQEKSPGVWVYPWVALNGIGGSEPAGPVANQLCNIAEGMIDWFRRALDAPELTHHDVSRAYDELDTGECVLAGEDMYDVHLPGCADIRVEMPPEVGDMIDADVKAAQTVIITRHEGAVRWLNSQGIEGQVVSHFGGKIEESTLYIGVLPIPMITKIIEGGARFVLLTLPGVAFGDRGQELTPGEMSAAGAQLTEIKKIVLEKFEFEKEEKK